MTNNAKVVKSELQTVFVNDYYERQEDDDFPFYEGNFMFMENNNSPEIPHEENDSIISENNEDQKNFKGKTKNQSLDAIVTKSRLKITDPIPNMPVCLELEQNGKVYKIGTLGNIILIQAKAKAGKTYLVSAMTAALLSSKQFIYFRGYLPEDKKTVLYFDTEQGSEDARTVQERIYKMAGLPTNEENINFQYYCLRRLNDSQRLESVEYIISTTENLGCVIIDGVRDLIKDFNDTAQSFVMINKLMTWTDEKQINIIAVLHQNPNDDKARGHLGTELTNKAEFILSISKERDEESYRRVEGYGRRKPFTPFNYSLDENGFPVLSAEQRAAGKIDPLKFDLNIHRNLISTIYDKLETAEELSLNSLFQHIKTAFKQTNSSYNFSDSQCKGLVHFYVLNKILKNSGTDEKMKLSPYK